jgi:hypothetical protein
MRTACTLSLLLTIQLSQCSVDKEGFAIPNSALTASWEDLGFQHGIRIVMTGIPYSQKVWTL